MSEITAALIEERNKKYLTDLQGNIGKYFSFLSTMARFHKYEVADLTSFAIEAPAMFTAVASKELWEKHFQRKINTNAKGITLIKDGKKTIYYDVSETESEIKPEIEVTLWQYDDVAHKKFIDAVVSDETSTEKQIQLISEELAKRSSIDEKSKKILALSVESVILERMGFSTENASRQLAKLSFKDHDITKVLEETQVTARIFLDAMQKSVNRQTTKNLDVPENNPLLEKVGVIKSKVEIEQIDEQTNEESKFELKVEPVQRGLFDNYTEEQDDKSVEQELEATEKKMEKTSESEKASEDIESEKTPELDDDLSAADKVVDEENSASDNNVENADSNVMEADIIEENPEKLSEESEGSENIKSDETSGVEDTLSVNDDKKTNEEVVEANTGGEVSESEVSNDEISEEITETAEVNDNIDNAINTTTNEENDTSDYDFEEMDEEEEILPDILENQSKAETLPEENQQSENEIVEHTENNITENDSEEIPTVEEKLNAETKSKENENEKEDLETTLAYDMKAIRGDNREKTVFRKNVKAIRTLQFIEREKRTATSKELEVLKDYAGFGGIPKAFDKKDQNWNREAWLLESMLTEKEYNAAKSSTLNAHYTSGEIVQGIYEGLKNLGFNQGTILEPSMGVGGFFGNMPDEMKSGSHLYGVELDSLTGRIAKAIYPDAEINIQGFEATRYLNDSFDIAVGNVPFGNYHVNDKGYNEHRFLIHDYFIAKMIDQVRPGGLVAVITSKGTLDKQDSSARKYFARRADLIRAIRLPNNAFKEAGTEVTSDILFFQKLENIRDEEDLPNWVNVTSFQGERDITINKYFAEHPEDVLGKLEKTSTAYGFDLTCEPDKDHQLNELLSTSMQSMTPIYSPNLIDLPLPQQIPDIENKRSSSYFIENGELKFYNGVKIENVKINAKDRTQMLLECH